MTTDHRIRDEKLQYDSNTEAAKVSALSSGKIDKYNFFTGEEILPSDESRIIEQAKFTYFPLGETFEKQIKTIADQGIKQVEALKALKSDENKQDIKSIDGIFPKEMKLKIKQMKLKNEKKELKYETKKVHI